MVQAKAKIISNNKIKDNYWHCVIDSHLVAKKAMPGQFIAIRLTEGFQPLLRRPFSIHDVSARKLTILYKVLGQGTQILSCKKPGEYLDIIGPLGNGFKLKTGKAHIIVAGGMGIAPLFFLSKALIKYKPLVLLGAKDKQQLLCVKEFKKLGLSVKIATDDGSSGFKGRVSDLLVSVLLALRRPFPVVYACGPKPMLRAISEVAREYNILAQVSLEEHMACGFGACLGCVVKTKEGAKRVCKEGPVFEAKDVIWG